MSTDTYKQDIDYEPERAAELYQKMREVTKEWGWDQMTLYAHLKALTGFIEDEMGIQGFQGLDADGNSVT